MASLLLAGCASPPPASLADGPAVRIDFQRVVRPVDLGGQTVQAEWHLPAVGDGPARGLVTLQHGFMRECRHLRSLAVALAQARLATLCVNASVAGGNAELARSLAEGLAAGRVYVGAGAGVGAVGAAGGAPGPRVDGTASGWPPAEAPVVVAGFSAGAHFAVVLGARLAELAPSRVAGAVLLDPVAGRGFELLLRQLSAGGQRPVLSLAAKSDGCNARHNAHPALRRMAEAAQAAGRGSFAGVVFGERSTHMDAEGEDTDWLAFLACGRRWPDPQVVSALRGLAVAWAADLSAGRQTGPAWPGGAMLEGLVAAGVVQPLR
jgi:hypothetical protein